MPIEVEVPDLGTVEFPDDMKEADISSALQKHLAQFNAPKLPDVPPEDTLPPMSTSAFDAFKSAMGAVGRATEKGGTAAFNIPIDVYNLGARFAGGKPIAPLKEGEEVPGWETVKKIAGGAVEQATRRRDIFGIPAQEPTDVSTGLGKTAEKTVGGFGTPGMLATLPFAELKLVQALFAGQMVASAPDVLNHAVEVFTDPKSTREQKVEAAGDVGVGALFAALLTHGLTREAATTRLRQEGLQPPIEETPQVAEAAKVLPQAGAAAKEVLSQPTGAPEATPERTDASNEQKATEVHGHLQPPAVEGAGQVPAEEGGAGVQPHAEGQKGEVLLSDIQAAAAKPPAQFAGAADAARAMGERAESPAHLEALRQAEDQATAASTAAKGTPEWPGLQQKKQFFTEAIRHATPRVAAKATGFEFRPSTEAPAMTVKPGDLTSEQEAEVGEIGRHWEFVRPGKTMGDSLYVPEGTPYEEVVAAIKRKSAEFAAGDRTAEPTTQFDPNTVPIAELPVANIRLSEDVPNFKTDADPETGVVPGQELSGKYERLGTAPIVVWKRANGNLEIITGRHRLDLAKRTGEQTIPAQVVSEDAGFDQHMALTFDAEANIRDGQGSVEDYAHYFKNTSGLSRAQAEARGLLARAKGKAGFDLGKNASDDLYASFASGKTTEAQALAIARAAPGNEAAQQIGLKFALRGKLPDFLSNVVKAAIAESGGSARALDLFGRDDSAMRAMAEQAGRAAKIQAGIREQISAVSGAAKNPALARKLGVDVTNPEAVRQRVQQLRGELSRWEDWPLHPDLVEQTKGKVETKTAPPVAPPEPFVLNKPESVEEQKTRLTQAAAKKTVAEGAAKPLVGSVGDIGQMEIGGGGDLFNQPKPPAPMKGVGAALLGETEPSARTATGIKNATVDAERAKRGLPAAMEPLRRSFGRVWDEAMAIVDQDPERQDRLIEELKEKPRAVSDLEDALILHRQIDLQNEYGKASRDLAEAYDDGRLDAVEQEKLRIAGLSDKLLDLYNVAKRVGTETARGLNARKLMAYEDFSLAQMTLSKRAANRGARLSPEQIAEIEKLHNKIAATQKAFDEYTARTQARIAELESQQAVKQVVAQADAEQRSSGGGRGKGRGNDPATERNLAVAGLTRKVADNAPREDLTPFIQRLARALVRMGIRERVPLIDAVHDIVKDIVPDMQWRDTMDAISGYGDFKPLSKDQVSVQLRDLKGQMQQTSKLLDMFQGEAPSKTGFERRAPTDVERRLIQQVNEAKKRFGIRADDPARQLQTALQSVKTRLRNQIADLEEQIASKQKLVTERAPAPEDAESKALKERRDVLKKEFDEIFGQPEISDEQRVSRALSSLDRQAKEIERQIKEGDIFPGPRPSKTPNTAELEAARAKRDALKLEREYLREAIQPTEKLSKEEVALKALKARLANRTVELRDKLARGDFSKTPRRTIQLDAEANRLKAENERAKQEYQRGLTLDRLKQRKWWEKAQDTFVKWRRAFVLSWPTVLAKLTGAAISRMVITPIEEAVGAGIGAAFPKLAERAPREGGFNARAEAKALTEGFTKGMRDAWQTLRTGRSDLDLLYGKDKGLPHEAIDFFGNLHGALKTVTKRNEFARSFEKRVAHALANGVDASDPLVQTRLALEAYKDANRSIFMQDNRVVSAWRAGLQRLKQTDKTTGQTPISSKALATFIETMVPIVKIPTNIVAETMQYATGSVTGSLRLARAYRRGIESLPAEQADLIMRQLKKGSLGAAVLLLGYLNPQAVGGFYQPGEKRKPKDVKAGSVRLYGEDIPGSWAHNPLLETLQIGSTVRRVADSKLNKRDAHQQGVGEGLWAGAVGLADEVPFVRETFQWSKAQNPHERATFRGDVAKSIFVPGAVEWLAREMDKDAQGNVIARKPKTTLQDIETGIPGLRQEVPRKPRARP